MPLGCGEQLGPLMVPADCSDARGTSGSDYVMLKRSNLGQLTDQQLGFFKRLLEKQDAPLRDGLCWYELPKFRSQYPEYADLNDDQLSKRLYEKAGIPVTLHQSGWEKLMEWTAIAVGVPVTMFILGWSLLWAFSGFRREQIL